MAVAKLALGGEFDQVAQQQAALGNGPAGDVRSVRGEVKGLALGARMEAHHALRDRWQNFAFAKQQLGETNLATRIGDVVQSNEVLDLCFVALGQCIPSRPQIG